MAVDAVLIEYILPALLLLKNKQPLVFGEASTEVKLCHWCWKQVHYVHTQLSSAGGDGFDGHLVFRFFEGSLSLAAVLMPRLVLSEERLRALMTASDLPNGESLRMLNAFGSGQSFSSMFIEQ
jgi:hypothetical protein